MEQAGELSLKEGKAEKKFSFDEIFIRNFYLRKSRRKVCVHPDLSFNLFSKCISIFNDIGKRVTIIFSVFKGLRKS